MRTPPRRAAGVALAGAVAAALAAAGGVAHAARSGSGAGRAPLAVVVVRAPSVADRVAARRGPSTEAEQRGWSAAAFHAQEDVLARLARAGQPLQPLHRLTRALDGFVARVDPAQALLLERDPAVEGVHPVRALRAVAAPPAGRGAGTPPGLDASGVGVARIGREAATGDALLAAIETALDPSGDGDTHDAARVIALTVVDPLAARFPGSPVARALGGAQALGAVVVTPVAVDVAATVVAARPGLTAVTVAALLRQAAAPWPAGPPDLAAALAAEVVAEAPVGGAPGGGAPGTLVLRNISSRSVRVRVAGRAGVAALPAVTTLAAGASLRVVVSASAAFRARAVRARAATLTLGVTPAAGAPFRVAVPLPAGATGSMGAAVAAGAPTLRLARGAATPTDARPARLTVVLPAATERLDIELLRGGALLGTIVRLRELLPGRYVVALTGRGPGGVRLAAGRYVVRALATVPTVAPSDGGRRPSPASRSVKWAIRSLK